MGSIISRIISCGARRSKPDGKLSRQEGPEVMSKKTHALGQVNTMQSSHQQGLCGLPGLLTNASTPANVVNDTISYATSLSSITSSSYADSESYTTTSPSPSIGTSNSLAVSRDCACGWAHECCDLCLCRCHGASVNRSSALGARTNGGVPAMANGPPRTIFDSHQRGFAIIERAVEDLPGYHSCPDLRELRRIEPQYQRECLGRCNSFGTFGGY